MAPTVSVDTSSSSSDRAVIALTMNVDISPFGSDTYPVGVDISRRSDTVIAPTFDVETSPSGSDTYPVSDGCGTLRIVQRGARSVAVDGPGRYVRHHHGATSTTEHFAQETSELRVSVVHVSAEEPRTKKVENIR